MIPPLRKPIPTYATTDKYAILLPLFFTKRSLEYFYLQRTDSARLRIEGFTKRALWLLYELVNYTDARDHGVPVYIIATSEMSEFLHPYQDLTGNIIIAEVEDYAYLTKIFLMNEAAKRIPATKYIMLDISHHIQAKPENIKYPLIETTDKEWMSQDMVHKGQYFIPFKYDHEQSGTYQKALRRFNTKNITEKEFYRRAAQYVGTSIKKYKSFWFGKKPRPYVFGSIHGITRDILFSKAFQQSLQPISELTGNDETFIELFLQKHFLLENDVFQDYSFIEAFGHDTWDREIERNTFHINAGTAEFDFSRIFDNIIKNMHAINTL